MNSTQGLLLGYLTRPLSPDQLTQEISILGIVATSTGRTVLLCLLVSLLSLSVIKSWLHSDPFGDIPGPFLARHTPFWLAWQARIGRRYLAVDALHQKYGPFVRIAPNHISVSHRDALNVVYGQGTKAFNKSQFYHAFIGNKPSVFSTTDRDDHAQKRRLVSHAFSANSLNSFAPYIHRILVDFVSQMDRVCETGQCIDALMWLNYLAFDILSELAFGEAIGMVSQGSDFVPVEKADGTIGQEHAIALVDEREHLAAVVGIHPVIKTLSKIIPDPFFIRGRKSSTGLIDLARRRVKKRLDSGADRDDLLGRLIGARLANNENGVLSESQVDELVAETVTLLIAGSDTTSNSCIGIIHLVMTHPIVYQKLMEELDDQVGNDSMPDWDRVKNLEYFSAVIREGLRVYATTAIGLHREVPAGGAYCLDRYFPEGTEMSVPAYTIQRDPMIWGDDPDVFRPERWIGRDESELKPYLMTFGRGPRACLGRNLAYIELRMILATIFLRYDITLKSDVLETTEGFMHKPLNMMVNLTRRKSTI